MQSDLALDERVLRMDICKREHAGDTGSGIAALPAHARRGTAAAKARDLTKVRRLSPLA